MRLVLRSALACSLALSLPTLADGISIGIDNPFGDDIDTRWGSSGYVTVSDQSITIQAVDARGRLLIAGEGDNGSVVRRLLANGQIDTGFGSDGALRITLGEDELRDLPKIIVPLADGGMLLLINHGRDDEALPPSFRHSVVHIAADGSLTPGYGGVSGAEFDGAVADGFRDSAGRLYLLTASAATHPETGKKQWWLRRLLANGLPDTSYGVDGVLALPDTLGMTMAPRVGEVIEIRYFDRDNGCDIRILTIVAGTTTGETCSGDSGRPIRLLSFPAPGPTDLEGIASWNMEAPDDYRQPYISNVNVDAQPHPLGFLQVYAPTQVDLFAYSPTLALLLWRFDSTAHIARTNDARVTRSRLHPDGSLMVSFNSATCESGDTLFCPPATLFKTTALALDLLPTTPSLPSMSFDGATYTSSPIAVTGLSDNAGVPARIIGGEISFDGETWLSGWVWVHNGREIRVRYPSDATLAIGGIMSPTHPTLAIGDVVTLQFTGSRVRIEGATTPVEAPEPNPAATGTAGSSGGGSLDWAYVALLALAMTARRLRRTSAH